MKKIIYILVVTSLIILIILAGDYFNFPLWPINLLSRTYKVEFHCKIEGYDESSLKKLLTAERGISLEIRDKKKRPLKFLENLDIMTDDQGIFSLHIPSGQYMVRAELMAYYGEHLYHFATNDPGVYEPIFPGKDRQLFELTLHKLDISNYSTILARLSRFLADGNLYAASALMDKALLASMRSFTKEQTNDLIKKSDEVKKLFELTEKLTHLPSDNYVSQLLLLTELKTIFQNLVPQNLTNYPHLELKDISVYLFSRIEAVKFSLRLIWSEYLTSMDNFLKIRNYPKVFTIWINWTKNPQLYNASINLDNPSIDQRIENYKKQMPKIKSDLVKLILDWIEKGKEFYEKNDLVHANKFFLQVQMIKERYLEELEFEPLVLEEIDDYIHDITLLRRAQRHLEQKNIDRVLELYSLVKHESQWLRVQKTDLKKRGAEPSQ